jgi:cytidine deaminase
VLAPDTIRRLSQAAKAAAKRAYAPASRFTVGAALLGKDRRVYCGCNVENASYGLTICAERNAAFHAVAEGCREFRAIAVWTPLPVPASPCGACRQVLCEFGPGMPVYLVGKTGRTIETTLDELLPNAFRFSPPRAR